MEQVIKKERKTKDKVVLTLENNEKLNVWLSLFDKWSDVVEISKSDLVNFILSERSESLSANEIKTLLKAMVNRNEPRKERKPRQKKMSLKANSSVEGSI